MKRKLQRNKERAVLFIHEIGYDFFNMGKLTYRETNFLINASNNREDEKEREMKVMRRR